MVEKNANGCLPDLLIALEAVDEVTLFDAKAFTSALRDENEATASIKTDEG